MKLYVVIDVGCHECGVSSEVIGAYWDQSAATAARLKRRAETGQWRDGGQSIPEVFEVEVPAVTGEEWRERAERAEAELALLQSEDYERPLS